MQELQLSKIARDLRKDLEMEQPRDSLRKLTKDYKSLQGPGAAHMQQSNIAHESSGEELRQIKSILKQLTRDHEKLREAVHGTSPRPKDAEKLIRPSAESRVDKEAKGSRNNHMAMHVDIEDQQSSALDRVRSAFEKNIARRERIEATGKKWIPSPRRQIYIGNIAFNATAQDVAEAIDEVTDNVMKITMPHNGNQNSGYAFVSIKWPSKFKYNGVDMDTFCDAIHRLDIKGRPIYAKPAKEAHHRDK
jgi:hypothetical protein